MESVCFSLLRISFRRRSCFLRFLDLQLRNFLRRDKKFAFWIMQKQRPPVSVCRYEMIDRKRIRFLSLISFVSSTRGSFLAFYRQTNDERRKKWQNRARRSLGHRSRVVTPVYSPRLTQCADKTSRTALYGWINFIQPSGE